MIYERLLLIDGLRSSDGSIYIHVGPEIGPYVKLALDEIFGPHNCQSEIVWKRTSSHNDPKRPGRIRHRRTLYGAISDVERKALAMTGANEIVFDWDVPSDHIYVSPEAEAALGLDRGGLEGAASSWLDLLHPFEQDRYRACLDALLEQRRGRINQEFRLRAADGHYLSYRLGHAGRDDPVPGRHLSARRAQRRARGGGGAARWRSRPPRRAPCAANRFCRATISKTAVLALEASFACS